MTDWLMLAMLMLGGFHLGARAWLWQGLRKGKAREVALPQTHQIQSLPALSVVMAARNEASNLQAFLPSILTQQYSRFEVVIALDRCEDESMAVLETMQKDFPQLSWITISRTPPEWSPKKWALAQAIDQAQYECLVCTDADCEAESGWLLAHGQAFATGTEITLGIGLYRSCPGWLNHFIRYETAHTALQYLGAAGQGHPYMGVGRNLGYRKSVYDRAGGFLPFRESLSGDDDLLVNHSRARNTQLLLRPGSRTWSEPKHAFGSWIRQKGRHFSASARYTGRSKIALALFHGSQISFYGLLGLILFLGGHIWVAGLVYLAYLLGSWYIFSLFAKELVQRDLTIAYPLLDAAYAIYHSLIAPFGLLAQPSWQTNPNRKYRKTPSRTVNS